MLSPWRARSLSSIQVQVCYAVPRPMSQVFMFALLGRGGIYRSNVRRFQAVALLLNALYNVESPTSSDKFAGIVHSTWSECAQSRLKDLPDNSLKT